MKKRYNDLLYLCVSFYILKAIRCNNIPRNEVVGGYTGFTMSVRPSVDKSYVVR